MNVYEAIENYILNSMYNGDGIASRGQLAAIVDAYDALAPDWSNAPGWAQWYAIDVGGDAYWWEDEPDCGFLQWLSNDEFCEAKTVDLPIGIDWRLCKWQRPEVK